MLRLRKRLERLESRRTTMAPAPGVCIYDPATGQPIEPADPALARQCHIWLPKKDDPEPLEPFDFDAWLETLEPYDDQSS